jgi:hypothetical protein
MKKFIYVLMIMVAMFSTSVSYAQNFSGMDTYSDGDESQWKFGGGDAHIFTMNYTMFGKSVANGAWLGGLGYATGMYLSGNRTGWGMVGSMVAVNIPLLLDSDYDKPELWIGQNLGAFTVSLGLTFSIEMGRKNKSSWQLSPTIRKR